MQIFSSAICAPRATPICCSVIVRKAQTPAGSLLPLAFVEAWLKWFAVQTLHFAARRRQNLGYDNRDFPVGRGTLDEIEIVCRGSRKRWNTCCPASLRSRPGPGGKRTVTQ